MQHTAGTAGQSSPCRARGPDPPGQEPYFATWELVQLSPCSSSLQTCFHQPHSNTLWFLALQWGSIKLKQLDSEHKKCLIKKPTTTNSTLRSNYASSRDFYKAFVCQLAHGPLLQAWESWLLPQLKQKIPKVKSMGSNSRRKERNARAEAGGGKERTTPLLPQYLK